MLGLRGRVVAAPRCAEGDAPGRAALAAVPSGSCRRRAGRRYRRPHLPAVEPLRSAVQEYLRTGERRGERQRLGAARAVAVQAAGQLAAAAARALQPHRRARGLLGRAHHHEHRARHRRLRRTDRQPVPHLPGLQRVGPGKQRPVRDPRQHQRLHQAQRQRTHREVHPGPGCCRPHRRRRLHFAPQGLPGGLGRLAGHPLPVLQRQQGEPAVVRSAPERR